MKIKRAGAHHNDNFNLVEMNISKGLLYLGQGSSAFMAVASVVLGFLPFTFGFSVIFAALSLMNYVPPKLKLTLKVFAIVAGVIMLLLFLFIIFILFAVGTNGL